MVLPMTLNPNFAFWEPEIGDMTTASHAEVYFTISSVRIAHVTQKTPSSHCSNSPGSAMSCRR